MRQVEYLSPSSIATYYQDPQAYYLKYLADYPPPREPQTAAMAVGSSFDAYTKSYLHNKLFGNIDPRFEFQTIFEAQVEPQCRDKALIDGKKCFDKYTETGALNDLMILLSKASSTPRFEFDLHGAVEGYREGVTTNVGAVILLGKPDAHFVTEAGVDVILDWKVNGFYSSASPAPGYINLRPDNTRHKDVFAQWHKDVQVNMAKSLDLVKEDWAAQLSIYAWLLGMPMGSQFVVAIDQLACRNGNIRIAEHRAFVSDKFQFDVFRKAQHLWDLVHSDYFFRDVSFEESQRKCAMLDEMSKSMDSEFQKML